LAPARGQSQFTLKNRFSGERIPPRARGGGGPAPRPRHLWLPAAAACI